ncbi:hypothetical protein [Stenotrophomonas tumulicola]|uniref:Uncharacterized protein n=1 Tax=Stenotrophomonas tumulicola TaxID=1685415 RepID=A0A7W3FP20_9GAMM|nr:hypothetical protein [Stenotrophomonas tumulicola]MBA8682786.1 hypothetical protein [Stenotrophomonas tumulicola]
MTPKPHSPDMVLEAWLSERPIPVLRTEHHPLGLIGLQGLPLRERNGDRAGDPWPSRSCVVGGTVAHAIATRKNLSPQTSELHPLGIFRALTKARI